MKVLRWLDANLEKVILCVFLAVISIIMFVTIILRNVMAYSIAWGDELARFLFIWTAAIGVSFATKNNSHLKMDILPVMVPKIAKPLEILGDIALAILAVVLARSSIPFLKIISRTRQISGGMKLPMKYVYVSFTIGFSLTFFRLLQKYIMQIVRLVRKTPKPEAK